MPDCMRGWDEVGLAQALVVEGVEGEGVAAVGVVVVAEEEEEGEGEEEEGGEEEDYYSIYIALYHTVLY